MWDLPRAGIKIPSPASLAGSLPLSHQRSLGTFQIRLLVLCRPDLEKVLFKFFTYFLIGFLSFYYSVISPFIWYDLQIFSFIPWLVFFTLLMTTFKAQKVFLILMKSVFSYVTCTFIYSFWCLQWLIWKSDLPAENITVLYLVFLIWNLIRW